jgi:RES domain-containing protein
MQAALPDPSIPYQGPLYRALNPVWASKPLSGDGAKLHGGRFNAKGTPALYCALSIMGVVAEVNQIGRPFEPVTLVSYDANLTDIFDATDPAALHQRNTATKTLAADDWRLQMRNHGQSAGQIVALGLIAAGYAGMLVPSYVRGAPPGALNMVLWRWAGTLRLIDSEDRLASRK